MVTLTKYPEITFVNFVVHTLFYRLLRLAFCYLQVVSNCNVAEYVEESLIIKTTFWLSSTHFLFVLLRAI